MADHYEKKQKPKPQCKQWQEMSPEEQKLWVRYFKGLGPKPTTKGNMKWDE